MSRPSALTLRAELATFRAEREKTGKALAQEHITPGDRRYLENLYWRLDKKVRHREAKLELLDASR